jgi:hypothetical protein
MVVILRDVGSFVPGAMYNMILIIIIMITVKLRAYVICTHPEYAFLIFDGT